MSPYEFQLLDYLATVVGKTSTEYERRIINKLLGDATKNRHDEAVEAEAHLKELYSPEEYAAWQREREAMLANYKQEAKDFKASIAHLRTDAAVLPK